MVSQLPASDANYPIVFTNLVKRYKNDRLLAKTIENAQKVNSEDPIALRKLLDTLIYILVLRFHMANLLKYPRIGVFLTFLINIVTLFLPLMLL